MRSLLLMALAGAALIPAPAQAAAPMRAVIVHLDGAAALSRAVPADAVAGRMERYGRVAQASVLAQLEELRREGHARHVRSLWIANAVAVTADSTALAALRARADVREIETDSELPIQPADAVSGEPGVAATGAPVLWNRGIDGRGVTVATLDTGVDLTHPELAGRYRGGSNSWFDPYGQHSAPMDINGHGSQVTGVIVAGSGIGVAPGARFIAARVFNDAGASTDSGVHLAFQWLLDPDGNPATDDAPDVVNASWGAELAACDLQFEPDLQALRAAHILPVFAAGNSGPAAPSDTSPANLPEAFAVGATASATTIAPFSSSGPSRCGGGQFPALVAPGTGIRSTDRFGLDATGLAGTSFSAPHVAGALALLLQVAPALTADVQASLLTASARDLGPPGADSTFGAGSLDVEAAARRLSPTLDFVPPVLSGQGYADATLRSRATDASSAIAAAEWWADADPGVGAGQAMAAADGSLDSASEELVASAPLPPGTHEIGVRARDAAGNWSSAALFTIEVPTPAAPPPVVAAAPQLTALAITDVVALPLRAGLRRVASDGFEHGLGAWPRRSGAVRAARAAATAGLRGLRVTSVAGARASLQRVLPHASAAGELAFDLNPRTFSSAGAWIDVAAIASSDGRRLASVQLRANGLGPAQVRLSTIAGNGTVTHSPPHPLRRPRARLVLSVEPARAALTVDGTQLEPIARAAHATPAAVVALGTWRGAPVASRGYLDFDRVTVQIAPPAS
jgi:subtilisin family serine protease